MAVHKGFTNPQHCLRMPVDHLHPIYDAIKYANLCQYGVGGRKVAFPKMPIS